MQFLLPYALGMRLIYTDEAGTSGQEPVLVTAAVIINPDTDGKPSSQKVLKLIDQYVPTDQQKEFEFHGHTLLKGKGITKTWSKEIREKLATEFLRIIPELNLPVIYAAVPKRNFKERYKHRTNPPHPRLIAFQMMVEQCERWMKQREPKELAMIISDETTESRKFKDMIRYGFSWGQMPDQPKHIWDTVHFANSKDSIGLQFADFAAYIIKRSLMGKDESERYYKILRPCIKGSRIFP